MLITPHNWMTLVTDALDILPPELMGRLDIQPGVVGPLSCPACGGGWFYLVTDVPRCSGCADAGSAVTALVELRAVRPLISISEGERILASAILLRLPKSIELVVPQVQAQALRVNSRKPEHSAHALQGRIRSVVFPALGLVTDADGTWCWRKGQRLNGG